MAARRLSQLATVLVVPWVLVALAAVPAPAHGGPPPDSAYYRTDLAESTSPAPGVAASVDPRGEWIQLTYTGSGDIVVLGYNREPYLRITATSVEENVLSPATFLNQSMFADLPTSAPDSATPSWRRIDTTGTARWHDHRIHWMGQTRPPDVAADPGRRRVVGTWAVHALAGATPFDIRGTVSWLGKPHSGLTGRAWVLLTAANLPFIIAAFVWRLRSRQRQPQPAH